MGPRPHLLGPVLEPRLSPSPALLPLATGAAVNTRHTVTQTQGTLLVTDDSGRPEVLHQPLCGPIGCPGACG